jgi:hypothetical protein
MSPLCWFCRYLSVTGAVSNSYTHFCIRVSSKSLPIHSTEVGNTLRLLLARCNTTNKRVSIVSLHRGRSIQMQTARGRC